MAQPRKQDIADAVLRRHRKSYADELRIDLTKNTPAPLYQWLIASLLFSARISSDQALDAAGALFAQGWRTPRKMAASQWKERVAVLNKNGYARYDESTARYLADTTQLLLDEYDGDLRKLRLAADCRPGEERKLLKKFKGIGDVGADIFFREAQLAWEELYPFADKKALDAAAKLGLYKTPGKLAQLVDRRNFPRLLAGLVRADLAGEREKLLTDAA